MKKFFLLILATAGIFLGTQTTSSAQSSTDTVLTALKTIDPNILQYFPRWRVCEPNLQVQIRQAFLLLGYPSANLDVQNISVTAAPINPEIPGYTILLIEVGQERMVASEIDANMPKLRAQLEDPNRPYCHTDIPPSVPPTPAQAEAIISFTEPTNVRHSFSISAFEQSMKIGQSGFWLRSMLGTDQVGYHFWEAGEAKVVLQRPLYQNMDEETRRAIPYLINAHLGAGYRISSGLDNRLLSFLPQRRLDAGPGGKFVGGIDLYAPFHPPVGLSIHAEMPLQKLENIERVSVDPRNYARHPLGDRQLFGIDDPDFEIMDETVYLLRSTGQVTLFYNWWLDPQRPENFFRFDLGLNYAEVRETALLRNINNNDETSGNVYLSMSGIQGLQTFKPNEFGDWVYFKAEYRNQSAWPFGISLQYSNQMLLGRVYVPLLGTWLYLEGKYSTPLRALRPYELKDFFMISPILRLNI